MPERRNDGANYRKRERDDEGNLRKKNIKGKSRDFAVVEKGRTTK